ncbi:MAG: glycine cleavage system protein GcvH [Candidatus Sumerlaeaceae bacterium]
MSCQEIRFSKTHEWARADGELATIGITDYAVEQLNKEIVYVELPPLGKTVKQGETFGVVEAVKTAADLYAPLSGTVEEVNSTISEDPSPLCQDPQGEGWLIKIRPADPAEWGRLMNADDYKKFVEEEGHH